MKYASKSLERAIKFFARKEVLFLLFLVVLTVITMFRMDMPAGEDFYYHSRIAGQILQGNIFYDDLSYGGRFILPTLGLELIIAILSFITSLSIKTISLLLPILFGLGSFLILYSMLKRLNKIILVLGFLFILISPGFLYLFTRLSVYSAVVFFTLLSIYFLSKNYSKLSIASFVLVLFISFSGGVISLFIILIYCAYIRDLRAWLKFFVAGALFSLIYVPFLIKFGIPEIQEFPLGSKGINFIFQRYFFDFGSKFGLAVFSFLLSFFGISKLLKDKESHLVEYVSFVGLFILAYFFDAALFFLLFFASILAAYGFITLLRKRWQSYTIKYVTLLIFIYGLLFSGTSYVNQSINELPDKPIVDGLTYLESLDGRDAVFSYYTNGAWINAIAGKKNVMDSNFFYAPSLNNRWQDSQRILYSLDIEEISWLFDSYKIRYVFLDPYMKEELFESRDIGLVYVLKYSNKFKRLYNKNGVEVWEYAR
ncbi:MAG: hypothetical protein AB1571_03695 [Nanoarchaeota archaeon]